MGGREPSENSTSMTAPNTWVIFPMFIKRFPPFTSSLQGFRRTDDLHQLTCNRSLTCTVHLQGQCSHHLRCVRRRGIHGRHACAVLARGGFQQCPLNGYLGNLWQQTG